MTTQYRSPKLSFEGENFCDEGEEYSEPGEDFCLVPYARTVVFLVDLTLLLSFVVVQVAALVLPILLQSLRSTVIHTVGGIFRLLCT